MFGAASSSKSPKCSIRSEALAAGIISTSMSGYITAEVCEKEYTHFVRLLEAQGLRIWVINVSALSGFESGAVRIGARWFDAYKKKGGTKIIYVSKNTAARMAAQALGFGAGVVVQCVNTHADALEQLGLNR